MTFVRQPAVPVIAAAVGAIVSAGFVMLTVDLDAAAARSLTILAWLALVAAQGALAGLASVVALSVLWQVKRTATGRVWPSAALAAVLVGGLAAAVVFYVPARYGSKWPVHPLGDHYQLIMAALFGLYWLAWVLAAFTMWTVTLACPVGAETDKLADAQARIRSMLWLMGLQVGAATLSIGAFRTVVIDGKYGDDRSFPSDMVMTYGGFLTVLLAICFVPAYRHLQAIVDKVAEVGGTEDKGTEDRAPKPATAAERLARIRELRHQAGLETDVVTVFKDAVAICSPILGAAISLIRG